jgi:CspA family cold shock protein
VPVVVKTGVMASTGVVREFHPREGWGIIDGPDVPGGCWMHFSAIEVDGYRLLVAGQRVSFRAENVDQDGLPYRAVKVWTGKIEPPDPTGAPHPSGAYRSSLTIQRRPEIPDAGV